MIKLIVNNQEVKVEKGVIVAEDQNLREALAGSRYFKEGSSPANIKEIFDIVKAFDPEFRTVGDPIIELLKTITVG